MNKQNQSSDKNINIYGNVISSNLGTGDHNQQNINTAAPTPPSPIERDTLFPFWQFFYSLGM
jgi:hypothetical protein